ncbi:MAG: hypothetical protein LBJ67_03390 [Planctomycetaceae bacterium]|jgi:hypothetical protein|nr:hypothetical protein [Planctomycetaceae bacterium]
MKTKYYIFFGIIIITVIHVAIILCRRNKSEPIEYPKTYDVVVEGRIEKQILMLTPLTVKETVQSLKKLEYYEWPGCFIGAGTIYTFDDKGLLEADKVTLHEILSNRIFRKSLQELKKQPKKETTAIVLEELNITLEKYLKLYNDFFEKQSLDFSKGEAADGKPVLRGLRYEIFALILIAGSLELTELNETICKIVTIAEEQKNGIKQWNDELRKFSYLEGAALCNNLVLSSGLYGTVPQQKKDSELKKYTLRYSEHKFVDYSAPATEYDDIVRTGFRKAVPDKEYINIRYFEQATNNDVKELFQIVCSQ